MNNTLKYDTSPALKDSSRPVILDHIRHYLSNNQLLFASSKYYSASDTIVVVLIMSSNKPAIVLVQGSFQIPQVYQKLVSALESKGYLVAQPEFPSLTGQDDPLFGTKTLDDDSKSVQSTIEDLVEKQGKAVVVAMHSYGGLVGSNAIPKSLSWKERQARGKPGGVIHLFYFAAFLLEAGKSVIGTFGESPNNEIKPGGRFCIREAGAKMYSDLPDDERTYWEEKVIDQSYAVQTTELTHAAYQYIPSTYVVSENDQAVPTQYQEMFAASANAEVLRIAAGHSPMLSKPDELASMMDAAVSKA
ncbi:hypothetical protein Golomagni_06804 [Golovinomyces magnicellulatus]|nr:hypothetical protein Golomagni_06804 [Golovinomyces magnicellulatus]